MSITLIESNAESVRWLFDRYQEEPWDILTINFWNENLKGFTMPDPKIQKEFLPHAIEKLKNNPSDCYLIMDDEKVVGLIWLCDQFHNGKIYDSVLYLIDKDQRGKGYAKKALKLFIDLYKKSDQLR